MVIFHSYVKLPEGRSHVAYKPTAAYLAGAFLVALSVG